MLKGNVLQFMVESALKLADKIASDKLLRMILLSAGNDVIGITNMTVNIHKLGELDWIGDIKMTGIIMNMNLHMMILFMPHREIPMNPVSGKLNPKLMMKGDLLVSHASLRSPHWMKFARTA